jgi:hypothetical protein
MFRRTCGDYARVLLFSHTRGCGCLLSTRHSLRPLFREGHVRCMTRALYVPRECGLVPLFSVMPRHRVGANAPPDDRLRRGIQYAAASSPKHERFWNTGSPGQAGRRRRREWLFDIQTETRGLPRGARAGPSPGNDVDAVPPSLPASLPDGKGIIYALTTTSA